MTLLWQYYDESFTKKNGFFFVLSRFLGTAPAVTIWENYSERDLRGCHVKDRGLFIREEAKPCSDERSKR